MRIDYIHIRGFGRLIDRKYEFPQGPAILILEDNEAGKSTLAAAILAGLCGFPKRKRSGEQMKLRDVYQPWQSGNYGIEMGLTLDKRTIVIDRDFSADSITVRDALTMKDISSEFDYDIAQSVLYLPRDDFQRIAYINGKQAPTFHASTDLKERLATAIDGSGNETGAETALAALQNVRYMGESGPLRLETAITRLSRDIEEHKKVIARLESELDAAGDEADALDKLQIRRNILIQDLKYLDQQHRSSKLHEVRKEIELWERNKSELGALKTERAKLENYEFFPVHRSGELSRASARLSEAQLQLERLEKRAVQLDMDAAQAELGDIKRRRSHARKSGQLLLVAGVILGITSISMMILRVLSPTLSFTATLAALIIAAVGAVRSMGADGLSADKRAQLLNTIEESTSCQRETEGKQRVIDEELDIIHTILAEADMTGEHSLEEFLQFFEEAKAKHQRFHQISDLLDALQKQTPPPEHISELMEEETRLLQVCNEIEVTHKPRQLSEIEAELESARSELSRVDEEIMRLERTVGAQVESYRQSYPRIAEQLHDMRQKLDKLEQFEKATAIARQTLKEVSDELHRKWSVALNSRAVKILQNVSPEYDDIRFDESMNFTLRRASDGRLLAKNEIDSQLSSGAQDQVYLAARLAICEEISAKGESIPILFDDPLIAADDIRFTGAMHYIIESVTSNHQVIILSCHKNRHLRLFEERQAEEISILSL